jgi:hypothetical protein
MKFEEVLPLMRQGKKAQLKKLDEDRFWIICKQGFNENIYPDGTEWLSLACLDKNGNGRMNNRSWAIERWAIMSNDWEIIED